MNELETIIREATAEVEQELNLEDTGWTRLGNTSSVIGASKRIDYVKQSRLYYALDPLAAQSIRLWTDYTFGSGMSMSADNEPTQKALDLFWDNIDNRNILSASGQRISSDKLLVDGEIFFAIFLGTRKQATIRRIDPLEITEIITDIDDSEKVLYYKREWYDVKAQQHTDYYCSYTNPKDIGGVSLYGGNVKKTQDALVVHLPFRSIEQRGNPLLLPALDWIKQYRRFLASRVAITLAMAKFAWKAKVKGGATQVAAVKGMFQDATPAAGSTIVENEAVDYQPIKVDTGANNAYNDGRMLKLQVAASVGIPEQYFGDISIGNLATAKTVELPMMKQFQSYQKIWADTYNTVNDIVLTNAGVSDLYVDIDFPQIAPEDAIAAAQALSQIIMAFPDFAYSSDVQQQALIALGVNDPAQVIDSLSKESTVTLNRMLMRALKQFKEVTNDRDLPRVFRKRES